MKIKIDYTDHPDFGGPQSVLDPDTNFPIDPSMLIGKRILSVVLYKGQIVLDLENKNDT
ncbi:MAG: hypothetical protein PHF86_09855 [Candidatus Nanoarchaeia archaeon]|nr:hypothetical protein [Candidatus Nanoarchaeia archaeon]